MVESLAEEYIQEREHEFIYNQNLSIFLTTWNVASNLNPDELNLALVKSIQEMPDIIVIGLQEVEMSMQSIMAGENVDRRVLEAQVYSSIPKSSEYFLLYSQHLGGISLVLFAKISFKIQIINVTSGIVALGPFAAANKGAVCVSLLLRKSSLCIVCSHLPAHQKNVAARNDAFETILNKMTLNHNKSGSLSIMDHDYTYWLGDLNYRIEFTDFPSALLKYSVEDLGKLGDLDQLNMSRKNAQAFQGFDEAPISFRPTYKLTKLEGFIEYNKARLPAWCDRILFRSKIPKHIESIEYKSVEIPTSSDHYPVIGKFNNKIPLYNLNAYEDLLTKAYEFAENKMKILQPKISVPLQFLDFGTIQMFEKKVKNLTIVNTGLVDVEISIRYQSDIDPDSIWIFFDQNPITLAPGKSTDIIFDAYIDEKTNTLLPPIDRSIELIVILQIKEGRVYFITFEAQYQRGAFGYPLELLVKTNAPLKSESFAVRKEVNLHTPLQLLSLTNYIASNLQFAKDHLFRKCEYNEEVQRIMDMLDSCSYFSIHDVSVESACNALMFYFQCLPKKIIAKNTIHNPEKFFEKPYESMIHPFDYVLEHMIFFIKKLYTSKNKYLPSMANLCKTIEPLIFSDDSDEIFPKWKKKPLGTRLTHLFSVCKATN
ncbi:Inositol polyphosphate 5-phosphatase OCRL-1 [Thelohanellus kitauei]|uniref:Inositol polyphosphate 5-phosphatase OCRL-1 n=1 Tax=Thelohanellus kitauei TaxID=669202 RepID=A0A0C2J3H7_THEKT|nr:Inositol polyphosphate 5-phosphatase OCRL-1 [Thelohanellus kitauei]